MENNKNFEEITPEELTEEVKKTGREIQDEEIEKENEKEEK